MEKKETLNAPSLEEIAEGIKGIVFVRIAVLPEEKRTPACRRGIIFEEVVKNFEQNPIPRNTDPEVIVLEQVIIPLMEREWLSTPDIIIMRRQGKEIFIEQIGEIKFGFGGRINQAKTQQENFLSSLKTLAEDFEEILRRAKVSLGKRYKIIKPGEDCPLFYVVPKGCSLPRKLSQFQTYPSSFSREDIYQIYSDIFQSPINRRCCQFNSTSCE